MSKEQVIECSLYKNQWIYPDGRVWSLDTEGFLSVHNDTNGPYVIMRTNLKNVKHRIYVRDLINLYNEEVKKL